MVDRNSPPFADEITKFNLPDFQEMRISNGIDLAVQHQSRQPVILTEIIIPVGRVDDPFPGLSHYAAKMLPEGTKTRTSNEIASQIDFYGGYLEISPTLDHVSIKLYAIRKFFKELFSILIDILSDPVFPGEELERLKKIRVEQIRQQLAKNSIVASLTMRECLFGSTHPYGIQVGVEEAKGVDIDMVKAYFDQQFLRTPKVYIAGDVGDNEIELLKNQFVSIPFMPSDNTVFPSPVPHDGRSIPKEKSVQSSIRLGKLMISRSHPDYFALKITNELLGGFFGSRLMKNIREEKGLTYGIHSSVIHLQHFSYWQIGTDVLKEKKEEAMQEILKEIEKLQNTLPNEDELLVLKNYMKGKLLTSFDTIFNSLEMYKTINLVGLQPVFWFELFEAIDSITPEMITQTAQKYFDLSAIDQVIVG